MASKLPDLSTFIQAGMDPKTGLPVRMGNNKTELKDNIKKFLRIIDEQDAVNRGTWYNLPCNLTSQELERMLYYRGQLAFFYFKELDEFYFMPYALDGTIDFYGRFNTIHPVPMASGTTEVSENVWKQQLELLSTKRLKCIYGIITDEEQITDDLLENSCVLLHDYTKQMSQTIIPRQQVNDAIIDVMADCIPFMRTNLLNSTGVEGIRVQDGDQATSVDDASRSMEASALNSKPFMPVIGTIDFQELTGGTVAKAEDFMLAMQSLDNLRLSAYGIDNGGLFEKKAHELEAEAAINGGPIGLVMQDAVSIRQNFCNIVNSIWNLGIWYEPSENLSADLNGDGVAYDRDEDGEQTGLEEQDA